LGRILDVVRQRRCRWDAHSFGPFEVPIKFGNGDGWVGVAPHENMFVNATAADYYITATDIRVFSNDTPEESVFVDSARFFLLVLDVLFYALTAATVISVIALYAVKCFFSIFPARRDLL
tara:strand:- start:2768 stop:3127 length:360 start_codon:yes stop_codon:yes gene_type:complete